jgi:tRNA modification GTPase
MFKTTTIAAVATPPGLGGIAVVRVSGPRALEIAMRVFAPLGKSARLDDRRVVSGRLLQDGKRVDQVLAVYFKAPRSYTGEEMVEISCHGGSFLAGKTLALLLDAGAAPAGPGEFTRRAFLNGKIDLVQAEAVADLVRADSDRACRMAMTALDGALSSEINTMKKDLTEMIALVEANIDFSEEAIDLINAETMKKRLEAAASHLQALVDSYREGRIAREGLKVAIIGPPNAGKSSLFNALCGKERVIVDKHPGTTRDTVEESIMVSGQKITFIDTAGIRKKGSRVEKMGMALSKKAAQNADAVIIVLDGTSRTDKKSLPLFMPLAKGRGMVVTNKCDLKTASTLADGLPVSAKTGRGIERIKESLLKTAGNSGETGLISNERQRALLVRARKNLEAALELLEKKAGEELLAVELKGALACLGKITGEVTDDDILNHIFSRFCIGK